MQHVNLEQPKCCFVRLFKFYNSLYPNDCPADCFYLHPWKEIKDGCWYPTAPYCHNSLAKTVAHLCKTAEIPGYETNHSVRATNAIWFFDSNVDEQLIMERTGNLSTEGVRSHKWTRKVQCEKLSDILNCMKKLCLQEESVPHTKNKLHPATVDTVFLLTWKLQLSPL